MAKSTTHKEGILASIFALVKDKSTDAETLTVTCYKAFPSLFSMDLFKEYPRMDRVTKRISDLINDGLIRENVDSTYSLTDAGLEWAKNHSELVRHAQEKINQEKGTILTQNMSAQEASKEMQKLKRTSAYRKLSENKKENIDIADFMDFLKIDIYATKQLFDRKVKRISAICKLDKELEILFNIMSEKFGKDYTLFKCEIDKLIR